ncbi:MAG TPA: PAS domain S-box protein [Bacteroidota bacterium]|nr:PAS domain S-box protein [Bacteroidota bacterium]
MARSKKTKFPPPSDTILASRELKLIEELAREMLSQQKVHAVMQRLADELVHSFGFKSALVTRFDREKEGFTVLGISPRRKVIQLASKILKVQLSNYLFPFAPDRSRLHRELSEGKRWIGTDFAEVLKPVFPPAVARLIQKLVGTKGIFNSPLMAGGQMVGSIIVGTTEKKFSESEINLLTAVTQHAALAVQQIILIAENRRLAERYRLLEEVDRDILSQKDQTRVLRMIVQNVHRVVPCEMAGIYLFDPKDQLLTPSVFSRETTFSKNVRTMTVPLGKGVIGSIAEKALAEVINDAHRDPRSIYPPKARPEREHLIVVPLRAKGKLLGVLAIARFTNERFGKADLEIAQSLAEKSALAIENALLLNEEKERERELQALQLSSNTIGQSLDLDTVLSMIVREAIRLTPAAERGSIFLIDEMSRELYIGKTFGYGDEIDKHVRLRWGRGLAGYVARVKKGTIVDDAVHSPLMVDFGIDTPVVSLRSVIAVPLLLKGRAIGVLSLDNLSRTKAFTQKDLSKLELFALSASLAITNAKLHETAQREVKKIQLLNDIKSLVRQGESPQKVLTAVVQMIADAFGYHHVSILLHHADRAVLQLAAIHGQYAKEIPEDYEQPTDVGLLGWVARNKKYRLAQDVSKDSYYVKRFTMPTQSELCVPILKAHHELLGVLNIESDKLYGFSETDVQTMQAVASEIAGVFEETRLLDALARSEKKYRTLVEYANDAVVLLNTQGMFEFVNRRFVATTGYSAAEVVGKRFEMILAMEDIGRVRQWFSDSLSGEANSSRMRFTILRKDGGRRLIDYNGRLLREGRAIKGILGIARDITEQVELERKLRETESRYATFIQNTSEGIWRVEFQPPIDINQPEDEIVRQYNERAHLVEMNRATYEMYGFNSADQLMGRSRRHLIMDWEKHDEGVRRFIRQGYRISNWESIERDIRGEAKHFLNSYLGEVVDGKLVGMWGAQTDITELKRIERALFESEKKYRTLFERSRDAIFISTPEGKLVDINEAGVELFGYASKEEILKVEIARDLYVNAADREVIRSRIEQEGYIKDFELRLKKKSGEPIVVLETGITLRAPDGTVIGYQGILRDITKQKKAQEEIAAWRQRYDLIVASSGQMAYEYDVRTGAILWSGSVKDVLGYSVEEMRGGINQWAQLVHPDDRDEVVRLLEKAERSLLPYDVEYRFRKKDGSYIWMHDRGFFIPGAGGKAEKMLGMMQDVDEQRKLEERVRSSELKHRLLFEHANDAVVLMKGDVLIDCNPKALEMFDCSRNELLGQTFYTFSPPYQVSGAESKVLAEKYIKAVLAGVPQQFAWRHIRRDGTHFEAEIRLNKMELQGEQLIQAQIRDITGQLLAQEELARSEENYRRLIHEAGEAILVSDKDGNFVEANEKACTLLGYTRDELMILNAADLLDPPKEEAMKRYRGLYQRLLGEGTVLVSDEQMRRKDGTRFPYEMSAVLLGNGLLQSIVRDITEKKRAAEELNHIYTVASTSHGTELFENAVRAIAQLIGMNFVGIGELNEAANTVTIHVLFEKETLQRGGVVPLAGTPCEDIVNRKTICEFESGVSKLFPNDTRLTEKSIESFLGVPLFDSNKKVVGMISVYDEHPHKFTDHEKKLVGVIAQRISSELEMMRQRQREEQLSAQLIQSQKMESLGTLAGGIAHDFNNILAAILGYASLMRKHLPTEHQAWRHLEAIEKSAQRAAALAKQLLSFAHNAPSEVRPTNLNETVKETVDILTSSFPKSITITRLLDPNLPEILADPNQIAQVIMNLCINARDAVLDRKDTKATGEITISTTTIHAGKGFIETHLSAHPGNYVCLAVGDTGIGMPRDVQQRIFEPFYTTKEKGRGTGLGLSLVYGIVRNHNGFVDVYSEVGKGTTFKVYFPVARRERISEEPTVSEGEVKRGSGETILVVDDEAILRELVSEILFEHGYVVLPAANGKEAVEIFQREREKIKLVLLDMIMPEMDGPTTFAQLAQIDPNVRVLISSGFSQDSSVQGILNQGACGFVAKPYRSDDLLQTVASVLAGSDGLNEKNASS